jgi:hypothetical protein
MVTGTTIVTMITMMAITTMTITTITIENIFAGNHARGSLRACAFCRKKSGFRHLEQFPAIRIISLTP